MEPVARIVLRPLASTVQPCSEDRRIPVFSPDITSLTMMRSALLKAARTGSVMDSGDGVLWTGGCLVRGGTSSWLYVTSSPVRTASGIPVPSIESYQTQNPCRYGHTSLTSRGPTVSRGEGRTTLQRASPKVIGSDDDFWRGEGQHDTSRAESAV